MDSFFFVVVEQSGKKKSATAPEDLLLTLRETNDELRVGSFQTGFFKLLVFFELCDDVLIAIESPPTVIESLCLMKKPQAPFSVF